MTGYTHHMIDKNLDFNGFVWSCARNFGALIMMRDDPMDAPVPDQFSPSDYHTKRLREALARAEQWGKMSGGERRDWARQQQREGLAQWRKSLAERLEQNAKLNAMLEQAKKWTPPTADHQGLRDFMIQQLTVSIDGTQFIEQEIAKLEAPGYIEELVAGHYESLVHDVEYHRTQKRAEEERVAGRNGWMKALSDSVGPPPGSPTATVG